MEKKNITVTLYVSELVYDIQNKTYLTGRSRQTGQNHEEVANMQANDDDENLNQVMRSIGNAIASLKTKLSEYLDDENTTSNNEQFDENTTTVAITLCMPTNYNSSTRDTITAAMHQYVTNIAIGDWFTITNKQDASDYVALAAANVEQIREALNKRVRPNRRTAGNNASRFNRRLTVATPSISVISGQATITCETEDATIYYTINGTIPSRSSEVYNANSKPAVNQNDVIRALAVRTGMNDSNVAQHTAP